jgi:hypothetical protein
VVATASSSRYLPSRVRGCPADAECPPGCAPRCRCRSAPPARSSPRGRCPCEGSCWSAHGLSHGVERSCCELACSRREPYQCVVVKPKPPQGTDDSAHCLVELIEARVCAGARQDERIGRCPHHDLRGHDGWCVSWCASTHRSPAPRKYRGRPPARWRRPPRSARGKSRWSCIALVRWACR